jgi:hypothetical protein
VGAGKPFDTDKYFIILPTAIGSAGSSCPSVSGLNDLSTLCYIAKRLLCILNKSSTADCNALSPVATRTHSPTAPKDPPISGKFKFFAWITDEYFAMFPDDRPGLLFLFSKRECIEPGDRGRDCFPSYRRRRIFGIRCSDRY